MRIVSKDELFKAKPSIREFSIPELGENAGIVIKGYSVGDVLAIDDACWLIDKNGKRHYNAQNDRLYSVLRAVAEPRLNEADTAAILELRDGIADEIISIARELSGRTQSAYDELKESLRANPVMRRLYSVCVKRLHRLPSELTDVPEHEFMMALGALELDAEDEQNELDSMIDGT